MFSILTFNIFLMSISFAFLFTGFNTSMLVQTTVLEYVRNETNFTFNGDGYISGAVIYIVMAICNWIAPSIIVLAGPRICLFAGAIPYVLYLASFLYPLTWLLYLMAGLVGLGAAVIWTSQGAFLTMNSTSSTMSRNSGLFVGILQINQVAGSLFATLMFRGKPTIPSSTRMILYGALTGISTIGAIGLAVLRNPKSALEEKVAPNIESAAIKASAPSIEQPSLTYQPNIGTSIETAVTGPNNDSIIPQPSENSMQASFPVKEIAPSTNQKSARSLLAEPVKAFVDAIKLFLTFNILFLCPVFIYVGLYVGFASSVLPTAISHIKAFGENASFYMGLTGFIIGVGEVIGGGAIALLGMIVPHYRRTYVIALVFVMHIAAYVVYLIQIPFQAPLPVESIDENDVALTQTLIVPVLAISFIMGVGDAFAQSQLMNLLGTLYSANPASAFALFKFVQSLASAAFYFYSRYLLMPVHLGINMLFMTAAAFGFAIVEWRVMKKAK